MNTLPFSELVEINPRVKIEKTKEYPFIEMGIVESGRRYVRADQNRIFQSGGAKFLPGDTLFARITPCLENGKIAQYQDTGGKAGFGSTEFFVFRARHCIRHGVRHCCIWLDDTEPAVPPTHGLPCLAKSLKLVAGWRVQTKTPTPRAVAT